MEINRTGWFFVVWLVVMYAILLAPFVRIVA